MFSVPTPPAIVYTTPAVAPANRFEMTDAETVEFHAWLDERNSALEAEADACQLAAWADEVALELTPFPRISGFDESASVAADDDYVLARDGY